MKQQGRKPKFKAGQVAYDKEQREYFKVDAYLAKLLIRDPDPSLRPLTARERGQ